MSSASGLRERDDTRPRRVLVIDDAAGIHRYVSRALGAAGYQVVEALDGRSGIELALDQDPDVILLDLGLPDLPGAEVLRRIRAVLPRVPVIVWSAAEDAQTAHRYGSLGADDFLPKPAPLATLLASVDEMDQRHTTLSGRSA